MSDDAILNSIDGSVQAQGIKVGIEGWLVIGSQAWNATPDQIKSYAYQAAKAAGWNDKSLTGAITRKFPHLDEEMMLSVIDTLKYLVEQHPAEIVNSTTPTGE
jgi:hypothetical protein